MTSSHGLSDTEEVELYPKPCTSTASSHRENNWIDITVAGEIERGNKLRQNKPIPCRRKDGQPKIVNPTNSRKRRKRKTYKDNNTSPCGCSYWSTQPQWSSISPPRVQSQNFKRKHRKDKKKCTVRTAQLAAPSKRYCLDTWRNNADLLPSVMVERLRQHVLDQRPILDISDAIYCFQRKKPRRHKRSTKNAIKRIQTQMPQGFSMAPTLSLIFSQHVLCQLLRPLNITLSPDLERLARIVSYDLVQIMNVKKTIRKKDFKQYRAAHADITCKVTVWIAGILDDLKNKILEEQLRELEEEEGPVLDFLDDVVLQVMDICIPKPVDVYVEKESDSSTSSNKDPNDDEIWQDAIHILPNEEDVKDFIPEIISDIDEEPENLILKDKEYFEKEIFNLINDIFDVPNDDVEANVPDDNVEANDNNLPSDDYILTDIEYFENEIFEIIKAICKDESEASETSSTSSKNVMFSISDMGEDFIADIKRKRTKSDEHKKRNIIFAEPNPNILSYADEVWPQDQIASYSLKPSASVTKSILSLGDIIEGDEKSSAQKEANGVKVKTEDKELQQKQTLKSMSSLIKILQSGQGEDSQVDLATTIESLMNILQNDETLTPEQTNAYVAKKLELLNVELPDKTITSMVTLLNTLRGDPKLLSAENTSNYITEQIALLNVENAKGDEVLPKHNEVSRTITSLINILQNDETMTPDEVNAIITQNLNLLNTTISDEKASASIKKMLIILQDKEKLLTPIETKVHVAEILALLNTDLHDDNVTKTIATMVKTIQNDETKVSPEIRKTMTSLLNTLQDDTRLMVTENNQQDLEESRALQNLISLYLADKCHAESQTDRVKALDASDLAPTKTKLMSIGSKLSDRHKVKTKNKRIGTDSIADKQQAASSEWKVETNTVPSWFTQTNAHGEPSEDSKPTQSKYSNFTKCDISKWSANLNKGYKNLEIWSIWLQSTCVQAVSLLRKRNICICFTNKHTKHWLKLRYNITKDSVLWRKLYKRTHKTFKPFQKYYGDAQILPTKRKGKCDCQK